MFRWFKKIPLDISVRNLVCFVLDQSIKDWKQQSIERNGIVCHIEREGNRSPLDCFNNMDGIILRFAGRDKEPTMFRIERINDFYEELDFLLCKLEKQEEEEKKNLQKLNNFKLLQLLNWGGEQNERSQSRVSTIN